MQSLSPQGLQFLCRQEGFRPEVYKDDAGNATIGYGHRVRAGESYPGGITEPQARALLSADVAAAENAARENVMINLTQPQFDALVSFAYNVGADALHISKLLSDLNAGDLVATADEFLKWNKVRANGAFVQDAGLTNRRHSERHLFLTGDYDCVFF